MAREYETKLASFNNHIERSRKGYKKYSDEFKAVERSYGKLTHLREGMLQEILDEKGLATCAWGWAHSDWKNKKTPSLKDFGIFPKSEMKLSYIQGTTQDTEHFSMVTSTYGIVAVWLLCPEHFPGGILGVYDSEEYPLIESEVNKKDGKFIAAKNGLDITRLVKKREWGRYSVHEVSPDGQPLFLVDKEIYRYFGIPDLPPSPDRNHLELEAILGPEKLKPRT